MMLVLAPESMICSAYNLQQLVQFSPHSCLLPWKRTLVPLLCCGNQPCLQHLPWGSCDLWFAFAFLHLSALSCTALENVLQAHIDDRIGSTTSVTSFLTAGFVTSWLISLAMASLCSLYVVYTSWILSLSFYGHCSKLCVDFFAVLSYFKHSSSWRSSRSFHFMYVLVHLQRISSRIWLSVSSP